MSDLIKNIKTRKEMYGEFGVGLPMPQKPKARSKISQIAGGAKELVSIMGSGADKARRALFSKISTRISKK